MINAIEGSVQDPQKRGAMMKELFKSWYTECSVTGKPISLDKLKYWDVDRQEIYASGYEATQKHIEFNKDKT